MRIGERLALARAQTGNGSDGPAGTGKAVRKRERSIAERIAEAKRKEEKEAETSSVPIRPDRTPAEAYAAALQEKPEPVLWKQDKQLPVDKTPLHTALERVHSGKSVEPTLAEAYAAALPMEKVTFLLPEPTGGD